MRRNRKGQGMLEYIIIITVILAALFAFSGGTLKTAVGKMLDSSANQVDSAAGKIKTQ